MQAIAPPVSGLAHLATLLANGSFILLTVSAALTIRDARHVLQGQLLIAVLLSVMAFSVTLLPGADLLHPGLKAALRAGGIPNLGLLWWFCLSLLRDNFRIGLAEWGGLLALAIVPTVYFIESLAGSLPFSATISAFGDLPPMAMIAHVIWVAASGRASDLVETRRHARIWLALAPLAALLVSLFTESLESEIWASIIRNGLGIMPMLLVLQFWLTRMRPERLQFATATLATAESPTIAPKDAALHRRLIEAMDVEQVYLRPGLTIDALAAMLKVPPHQLRQLINSGLGHRNFAAFLNGYRIDHAKAALADDERARDTVLAIAFEAGFASLQSFNRVFKEAVGVTPTDFRTAALKQAAQS